MGDIDVLDKIFAFLEMELTSDGLQFLLNVKKCYEGDNNLFQDFIFDYLSMQSEESISDSDDIYKKFVIYYKSMMEIQDEDEFLEQFARYAKYYLMLHYEYVKDDSFKHWISIINRFNGKIAYPFLMELLDDFEHGRIRQEDLNEMALMVVNLLKNSDHDDSTLRYEFSQLGSRINEMLIVENKEDIKKAS